MPRLSAFPAAAFCVSALWSQTSTLDVSPYRETANQLIAAARADQDGYAKLAYLCDRIGNRVSGSANLDKAIAWAQEQMKRDGLENVRTVLAKVPHWVRGRESAAILAPISRPLTMLGLGNSVGTSAEGVTAEVVPVANFAELDRLGRAGVAGKIVLYNVPYQGYGKTVAYRIAGPSRASALGAVAILLRSVGSATLQTPHTGVTLYAQDAPKIPAAAVTPEDALLMQRLHDAGDPVRVHLTMEAKMLPDADSADVMGEIRGREKPDEVVVLGGHIDSWDVGQGAQDDGSGIIASLEAVALMKKLNLHPRRTVRVVFWTNEENGGAGGRAYRNFVGDAVKNHVAAIEMDGGAEQVVGFGLGSRSEEGAVSAALLQQARAIGHLLDPIHAGEITSPGGGADIEPLMQAGVPGFGLRTVGTHYFDWHHTQADTVDKIDPAHFRDCTAALAVLAYTLAEMPTHLGQ